MYLISYSPRTRSAVMLHFAVVVRTYLASWQVQSISSLEWAGHGVVSCLALSSVGEMSATPEP